MQYQARRRSLTVLPALNFSITTIPTKIFNFRVPPSRGELRSGQTMLQTNSALAGTPSGVHTTTAATFSSSISRNIQKISRFSIILRNPIFFWIFRGGGYSMVPLPLVLVSRDTWTTPGKTLAWWYESSSADMISVSKLLKKSHGIVIIWEIQPNHQI